MTHQSNLPWNLTSRQVHWWLWAIDLLTALVVTTILARCDGLANAEFGNSPFGMAATFVAMYFVAVVEVSLVLFGTVAIIYALAWCCVTLKHRGHADS